MTGPGRRTTPPKGQQTISRSALDAERSTRHNRVANLQWAAVIVVIAVVLVGAAMVLGSDGGVVQQPIGHGG